jgi:hypothetical protein
MKDNDQQLIWEAYIEEYPASFGMDRDDHPPGIGRDAWEGNVTPGPGQPGFPIEDYKSGMRIWQQTGNSPLYNWASYPDEPGQIWQPTDRQLIRDLHDLESHEGTMQGLGQASGVEMIQANNAAEYFLTLHPWLGARVDDDIMVITQGGKWVYWK